MSDSLYDNCFRPRLHVTDCSDIWFCLTVLVAIIIHYIFYLNKYNNNNNNNNN